jgi:phosphatidylserine/phosphatidylglycerophosphate/cardiolipin synthase-like enzyme
VAENEENRGKLPQNVSFPLAFVKKPYLHGKFILQDGESIFLGSQNFTKNSLENNREIGIFIRKNEGIY